MTAPDDPATQTTVPVLVSTLPIEDGETPQPTVGHIGVFRLHFREYAPDPTDPTLITAAVSAETLGTGNPVLNPGWNAPNGPDTSFWEWTLFLRGDGWTATWYAPRPVLGHVQLTGRLVGSLGYDTDGEIRGRITRVRLVANTFRPDPDNHSALTTVSEAMVLTDVDTSPRMFNHPTAATERGEVSPVIGVLVDLDLADMPALPLRPLINPGAVSASGNGVWVLDRELPQLVRISGNRQTIRVVFPGQIFSEPPGRLRRVHADPAGCWVAGWDGVHRCTADTPAVRIDSAPVGASAAHDGTLVTATDNDGAITLTLYRPSGDSASVPVPAGRVDSLTGDETGFWALITVWDPSAGSGSSQLVHLNPDSLTATTIALPHHRTGYRPFLLRSPVRLVDSGIVYQLRDGTDVMPMHTFPTRPLGGGMAGTRIWIVTHAPDGTGPNGWWPLTEQSKLPRTPQYWLLTLLDSVTLEPVLSAPIFDPQPDVTEDADGTLWITARGLRTLADTTMTPPIVVDLDTPT